MLKKEQLFLYVPLFAWMGTIFYFSSVPGGDSSYAMPLLVLLERKMAHVMEYIALTFLIFRVMDFEFPSLHLKRKLIASGLFSFLYACSDELHQLFVYNRTGKITDVMIDGVGIFLVVFALNAWFQNRNVKKVLL